MMTEEEAQARAQDCAKDGNLIEAGWVLTVLRAVPEGLSEVAVNAVRRSFYAGANHMLAVMAGAQRRDNIDMERVVGDLRAELARFREEMAPKEVH